MKPIVSVILPVYNSERYIEEAINSVLRQSFKQFELIIIDDKSTDNTVEVIERFKDERVRIFLNEKNIGRASSDNFALSVVQGKYIAKMDGDDVCHPQRLEKQVLYLDEHSQVNVVGSWIQSFGDSKYLHKYPLKPEQVACRTLLGMPIGNSSLMLRSELFFEKRMRYNESLRQAEDYDFFAKYLEHLYMYIIPEPLLNYRTYSEKSRENTVNERKREVGRIRRKFLFQQGFAFTEAEYCLLDMTYNLDESLKSFDLLEIAKVLNKIIILNDAEKVFDVNALKSFLATRWFYVCYHHKQKRLGNLFKYYESNLSEYGPVCLYLKLKMFFKALINF